MSAKAAPIFTKRCGHAWILFLSIGLLSLSMRLYFVTHAVIFQPANVPGAHGDAVQYYNYAYNLVNHRVFSVEPGVSVAPVPDSFRDPGYPLYLATLMKVFPVWDSWYAAVLLSQSLIGALTVLLWLGIGLRWMSKPLLWGAGVIMAVWPHSITINSDILSETLFGFWLALAVFLFQTSRRRSGSSWLIGSGLCFAFAALTNSVIVPYAALLAIYLLCRKRISPRNAAIFVVAYLCVLLPWTCRNLTLHTEQPDSSHRVLMNLVQGSWPLYHAANRAAVMAGNASAKRLLAQIDNEIAITQAEPRVGLSVIEARLSLKPLGYLCWYLEKPALLWGWNIEIGAGDIYFHVTYNSPFDTSPVWRAIVSICHALNPILLLFAASGCVLAFLRGNIGTQADSVALMLLFVTCVHTVLQVETRYSIPYKGAEIVLSAFAAQHLWNLARTNIRTRSLHSK